MKIALCLSGQVRSFSLIKEMLFKNLLSKYNCDIFCHFWHRYDGKNYENFYNQNDLTAYGNYDDYQIQEIISSLKPKSLYYDFPFIQENSKSMLYSIYTSNKLKKTYEKIYSFKYDVVIRARWDLLYTAPVILEPCKDTQVYLINRPGGCGGVNDWFAYGKSNTMDIYSDTFKVYEHTERIKQLCAEGIISEQLQNNNINVNYINQFFNIQRKDGVLL